MIYSLVMLFTLSRCHVNEPQVYFYTCLLRREIEADSEYFLRKCILLTPFSKTAVWSKMFRRFCQTTVTVYRCKWFYSCCTADKTYLTFSCFWRDYVQALPIFLDSEIENSISLILFIGSKGFDRPLKKYLFETKIFFTSSC